MIKTKEATESAALEFCHILNKFAAQLDECLSFKVFCLKRSFRASFRRKLGGSAICSKCEQNSTAALSVAYLFFIIYSKSTVGHYKIQNFPMNCTTRILSNTNIATSINKCANSVLTITPFDFNKKSEENPYQQINPE